MLQKISYKSPNPDSSMHPKLNTGSFLKNRNSCIASILGLNHGSRSARLRTPFPLSTPPVELLCIPLLLPAGSPAEGYFNIRTVELCHWTQAVFISLKSYNVNGSRCLMVWLGGREEISQPEYYGKKGLDGVCINYNRISSRNHWLGTVCIN